MTREELLAECPDLTAEDSRVWLRRRSGTQAGDPFGSRRANNYRLRSMER